MQTILILEDDLRLNQHWRSLLESEGYHVISHSETDQAIKTLDNLEIDLVISDMIIRDDTDNIRPKGGLSLLAHIAMNVVPPAPKIIMITGTSPDLYLDKYAQSLQSELCLRKPIGADELVSAVKSLLPTGSE